MTLLKHFERVGMTCSDLGRTVGFYCGLLNLQEILRKATQGGTVLRILKKAGVFLILWIGGNHAQSEPLSADTLASRAELAAQYIQSAQLPTGLFEYEYDFLLGRFLDRDNIVRQAAAASVLAEYATFFDDTASAVAVKSAIEALVKKSVRYGDGLLASEDGELESGNAGATAFALLAELHYFEATTDERFQEQRLAWLMGLRELQLPSGGFSQSASDPSESHYFNGEAWLALAHASRLFPSNTIVKAMLAKADAYLIERYGRKPEAQFAHWGMMAASVRYRTTTRAQFLEFLSGLSTDFITELRPEIVPGRNACSSVEGLAAAKLALLQANGSRSDDALSKRIETDLLNSLELQILPGQTRISLSRERYLTDPAVAEFAGAFLNARPGLRTRIDSTQHCLSALLKYIELARSAGRPQ